MKNPTALWRRPAPAGIRFGLSLALAGLLSVGLLSAVPGPGRAQRPSPRTDSLQRLLRTSRPDTSRVLLLIQLAWDRTDDNPLAAIAYGRQSLTLARQLSYGRGECQSLLMMGWAFMRSGNYPTAMQTQLEARRLAEALGYRGGQIHADNALGYAYLEQGSQRLALRYFFRAKALAEQQREYRLLTPIPGNIGQAYLEAGQPDSAFFFTRQGYELDRRYADRHSEIGDLSLLGDVEARRGRPAAARAYYRLSISRAQGMPVSYALCRSYLGLARLARAQRAPTEAVALARQALLASQQGRYSKGIFEASNYLADVLAAQGQPALAYGYLKVAAATRDSLFSQSRVAQVQALSFSEQLHQQDQAEQSRRAADARRQNLLLAALAAAVPILLLLWRTNRQRQLANRRLNAQNTQILAQRDALTQSLTHLRTAQMQVMAAEKLASLGQLTAGIAHELQNPLALLQTTAAESTRQVEALTAAAGPTPPPATAAELNRLRQNLRAIGRHGQRATAIITDMLEHSRSGPGQPQPVQLNELADEYLYLAYYGQRARTSNFTATLCFDLDPTLPPVSAVASDLGRALLNLGDNAFYAVHQRQQARRTGAGAALNPASAYEPEVRVQTRQLPGGQGVELRVRDNGPGLSEVVRARVFQTFFTTKPAGEGTGLGLSLAHDIICRGHGGSLRVESRAGEFTEFILTLPL